LTANQKYGKYGGEEKYTRTPIIRNNWDDEPSGYAENPDNWIFLSK